MITKYEGPGNYVFVSYSHKDTNEVNQILEKLDERNIRIWYDEHIDSASEWRASIERHLIKCHVFVCYITENFIQSKDCRKELFLADKSLRECRIVPIVINESLDIDRHGVGYTLSQPQLEYLSKYKSFAGLVDHLWSCDLFKQCTPEGNVNLQPGWGPERKMYTHSNVIKKCVFNSLLDNVALGDERGFVVIADITETKPTFRREVIIKPGNNYQVYIYYHNNADYGFNSRENNRSAIAREVRLASRFSNYVSLGEPGEVSAVLSWQDFDLKSSYKNFDFRIWSSVLLLSSQNVRLRFKEGSLRIYNNHALNGAELPVGNPIKEENINGLFSNGTYLGIDELDGMILGGEDFSGHVVFTLEAFDA